MSLKVKSNGAVGFYPHDFLLVSNNNHMSLYFRYYDRHVKFFPHFLSLGRNFRPLTSTFTVAYGDFFFKSNDSLTVSDGGLPQNE